MAKAKNHIASVLEIRDLTDTTYVLRIQRRGLIFEAGQYISLGLPGNSEKREYSIYSGVNDDYLEVLVKEIDEGLVSKQLKYLKAGAHVEMDGPFGFFTLKEENKKSIKPFFIASGTGIAPFHSFVRSNEGLLYTMIHGVRLAEEAYDSEVYKRNTITGESANSLVNERDLNGHPSYILCASGEPSGDYHGRVTDYLRENPGGLNNDYYLCGNSNMIHEVYDILRDQGVDTGRIHAEVYF